MVTKHGHNPSTSKCANWPAIKLAILFAIFWAVIVLILTLGGCASTRTVMVQSGEARGIVTERSLLLGEWETTVALRADDAGTSITATDRKTKNTLNNAVSALAGVALGLFAAGGTP